MASLFVAERHTHKRHPMLNGVSGVLKPVRSPRTLTGSFPARNACK